MKIHATLIIFIFLVFVGRSLGAGDIAVGMPIERANGVLRLADAELLDDSVSCPVEVLRSVQCYRALYRLKSGIVLQIYVDASAAEKPIYQLVVSDRALAPWPQKIETRLKFKAEWNTVIEISVNTPNQALQHNDPSCHESCLRTPRASRDRG